MTMTQHCFILFTCSDVYHGRRHPKANSSLLHFQNANAARKKLERLKRFFYILNSVMTAESNEERIVNEIYELYYVECCFNLLEFSFFNSPLVSL